MIYSLLECVRILNYVTVYSVFVMKGSVCFWIYKSDLQYFYADILTHVCTICGCFFPKICVSHTVRGLALLIESWENKNICWSYLKLTSFILNSNFLFDQETSFWNKKHDKILVTFEAKLKSSFIEHSPMTQKIHTASALLQICEKPLKGTQLASQLESAMVFFLMYAAF